MAVMNPNNPFSLSAAGAGQVSVSAASTGTSGTLNETMVLEKAKNNLYQKSTVIDMVLFAESPDEVMLKDKIREDLRFQMANHLAENMTFTRTNDHANDTMVIHGRCYAFTREQLLDFVRDVLANR